MVHHWGYMAATLSAVFYGISYSLYKLLLVDIPPLFLAGFTYFTSGLYLLLLRLAPGRVTAPLYRFLGLEHKGFPTLTARELVMILAIVFLGAFLAPYIFLNGLRIIPASDASLLSISELLFTLIIAAIFLKERFRLVELLSIAAIGLGLVIVTTNLSLSNLFTGSSLGYLLVLTSCLLWAIDNNVSRVLTLRGDAIEVAASKSLIGGLMLLSITLITKQFAIPVYHHLLIALTIGIVCLGNSLLLFFVGLYHIGSGRTTSIFATNSLFGVFWAYLILRESILLPHLLASLLIFSGIVVLYKASRRNSSTTHYV